MNDRRKMGKPKPKKQKIGRDILLALYPDALSRTYCVPPIHFNRVAYVKNTVAGQSVLVRQDVPGYGSHGNRTYDSSGSCSNDDGGAPVCQNDSTCQTNTLACNAQNANALCELKCENAGKNVCEQTPSSSGSCTTQAGSSGWNTQVKATTTPSLYIDTSTGSISPTSRTLQTSSDTPRGACETERVVHASSDEENHAPQADLTGTNTATLVLHSANPSLKQPGNFFTSGKSSPLIQHEGNYHSSEKANSNQPLKESTHALQCDQKGCNGGADKKPQKNSPASKVGTVSSQNFQKDAPTKSASPVPYRLWPLDAKHDYSEKRLRAVQYNDIQEDVAQNVVLANLEELGKVQQEVMFILSEFSFDDYLTRQRASRGKHVPRAADLDLQYRRGDFDVLIIHRQYGVMVGEVKSVGWNQDFVKPSQSDADADVAKRVEKAVRQLHKSETVVRHLLSDVVKDLKVKKTLFLPFICCDQLEQVFKAYPGLEEDARTCLGLPVGGKVTDRCCCANQLVSPDDLGHVTPAALSRLSAWWRCTVACDPDPVFSDDLYFEVVGRFVGPASSVSIHCVVPPRVEVRTEGEAVSELGRRLARLVLTPKQLDLIIRSPRLICITGPPGTGKTVVLILMGLKWLLDGHNVHVISTRPASLASSQVMYYQLNMTQQSYTETNEKKAVVHLHRFNFYEKSEVDRAIGDLTAASLGGKLHVLMEEAVFNDSKNVLGPNYQRLVHDLNSLMPDLHLWMARVRHDNIPTVLDTHVLTLPLRSAPVVLREVQPGVTRHKVYKYDDLSKVVSPADGPRVVRLTHYAAGGGNGDDDGGGGGGDVHSGTWPHQCRRCGRDVADVLLRQFNVGAKEKQARKAPDPLRFSDVFVLTRDIDLQDDVTDDTGNVTSSASGVVHGLRDRGMPVCVLECSPGRDLARWEKDVADTAEAASDRVTVAHWRPVLGLERKVVVWLRGRARGEDEKRSEEEVEAWDRVWVVSRCTTQLVVVEVV
ncbi:uncharacterized protein [Littorina saxatilis]|uniref:uncharacterized protein n=1 Tax=Littorina saxatilis TaxID=31220 RepID=UPI0038B4CE3A